MTYQQEFVKRHEQYAVLHPAIVSKLSCRRVVRYRCHSVASVFLFIFFLFRLSVSARSHPDIISLGLLPRTRVGTLANEEEAGLKILTIHYCRLINHPVCDESIDIKCFVFFLWAASVVCHGEVRE